MKLRQRPQEPKGPKSLEKHEMLIFPGLQKVSYGMIQETEEEEEDPDDTPVEEIKASLRRALQEAKEGKRIPLSEMWEGIDVE